MPNVSATPIAPIYQLKITLRQAKPPIWRRVLVPGSFTLARLHRVIQVAMGWENDHLHQFEINGQTYGVPRIQSFRLVTSEGQYSLEAVAPAPKRKFIYKYDFSDGWVHEILVEKILPSESGATCAVCLAGERACPPEDVGGVWGYARFLEALDDPDHKEHDTFVEWSGGSFDSEAFDLDAVNRKLERLK